MARLTASRPPAAAAPTMWARDMPKSLPLTRWHVSIVSARPQGLQLHPFSTDTKAALPAAGRRCCTGAMLSYEHIIMLGEERVLVIQEHKEGRCWCGRTWH
ncbi:hypothetical protein FCN77_10545 [Arthrobacter sp. 24S4-2]|uniref:hypothetical protein n=1 Tax=Arthrobacter sp. 24S4-2 TaxID=2575374 RepID=UPI0010C79AD6|nr:hypothetical protein [Arthrobacter sp. 24S4-2]QCO98069.1 hypothetical protein FCN77_10545 [Arthrobacter sp. 24S4-2]